MSLAEVLDLRDAFKAAGIERRRAELAWELARSRKETAILERAPSRTLDRLSWELVDAGQSLRIANLQFYRMRRKLDADRAPV